MDGSERRGRGPNKIFLYDIVNNTRSGLDVDKIGTVRAVLTVHANLFNNLLKYNWLLFSWYYNRLHSYISSDRGVLYFLISFSDYFHRDAAHTNVNAVNMNQDRFFEVIL